MRKTHYLLLIVGVVAAVALAAWAWHEKEHFGLTAAAGRLLGDDVPAFFREGVIETAGQYAIDPDLFKHERTAQLAHAEMPEHFFDMEYFQDADLPRDRFDYYQLAYSRDLDPRRVGTLPWAVTEWTQKLTLAFAEHRRWPEAEHIQAKCLVYAGILSHYAADLHQPLHTTIHYDGRVDEAGDKSPRTGIHEKVDALLRKTTWPDDWLDGLVPRAYDDVWQATLEAMGESHRHVETVYELAVVLPDRRTPRTADPRVERFARDRARAAAGFIASLYLTAWRDSADIKPPHWLDRPALCPLPQLDEPHHENDDDGEHGG